MGYLQVILPISLLILSFLLKFLIDRSASLPRFIEAGFESPVDITFLSLSFIVAFTLSFSENANEGLATFIIFLIFIIIFIFAWRESVNLYEQDHYVSSIIVGVLNFLVSVAGLVYSINLITGL